MSISFSAEEKQRYLRHFSLPEVGVAGQTRLKNAKIVCIGAGGLGSPILLYLAAAGIGTLGIVDDDHVELSNLPRQVLYGVEDIAQTKAWAAQERLLRQNPHIDIRAYPIKLTRNNALSILQAYDIVLDATDNFTTRYLINDACQTLNIPHIHAGISKFSGECSTFIPHVSPCYRCLYPIPPSENLAPNCSDAGVLGILPGLVGTIQATEALKLALGLPSSLAGKMLRVNALTLSFETFILKSDPNCLLCGQHIPFHNIPPPAQERPCTMSERPETLQSITAQELKTLKDTASDFTLLDVRQPHEYDICHLDGTLIPLGELDSRHHELQKNKLIVVHCRTHGRSVQAVQFLQEAGFPMVKYLEGGILAWAQTIDPNMPQY